MDTRATILIILTIAVIVVSLSILIYILLTRKPNFDSSILNAINGQTYVNYSPPYYVDNFKSIPYAFVVRKNGTVYVNFKHDGGSNEGIGTFTADIYDLTDNSLTLRNFKYVQYPGTEVSEMPQGPWYLRLTSTGLTLSGHYENIMETLVRS